MYGTPAEEVECCKLVVMYHEWGHLFVWLTVWPVDTIMWAPWTLPCGLQVDDHCIISCEVLWSNFSVFSQPGVSFQRLCIELQSTSLHAFRYTAVLTIELCIHRQLLNGQADPPQWRYVIMHTTMTMSTQHPGTSLHATSFTRPSPAASDKHWDEKSV